MGRLGYLLILLLLTSQSALAQTQPSLSSVTGRVQTAVGGVPIQFANVTLHRATDSLAVKTEFSDVQGAFRLEQLAGGAFLVSVTQVGFAPYWSPAFELTAGGQNLANIALQASAATQLKEVTVVKQKPLYEHLADRTIVNVEGSTLASGNTSLDVLTRAPGITVGSNDNLALRGRQGLLVLIDGKRQPMTGSELSDYLRALPAEQLSSIELITNPPAKYDAQGGAGIIAINLKKDQRQGTNGTANAAYGRGQYGKFTTGLTLNHRQKKINAFGSYAYTDRENFQKLTFDRFFYDAGVLQSSSIQRNNGRSHLQSHTWRGGLDYSITKRTVIGVVVGGLDSRFPGFATNRTLLFDAQGQSLPAYRSTINRRPYNPSITSNLNFRHSFADSSGAPSLSVDIDYDRFNRYADQELTTFFSEPGRSAVILDGDQEGHLTIQSVKADYTRNLRQATRLEAGLKATLIESDNDLVFEDIIDGVRTPNLNFSNQFRYKENINAAYVTLTRTLPKLTISAGLRGEQTNVEGQQAIGNEGFDRNYFQLFPSASVQRKLSDKHDLSLSLSRRINRPTYNQLNPFRSYVDATSYRTGNPYLRPETSYNIELTHTFKEKYSAALTYSITDLPIINVVQPASEGGFFVVNRDINLRTLQYYALTLTVPLEPTKWWSVYNNLLLYYNHFEGKVAETMPPSTWATVNVSSNNTFTFSNGWKADLSGTYLAPERYGYERLRARGQIAIGLQKQLWANKASVKLNATDILYTSNVRSTYAYANFEDTFFNRQDTRVATLSFTYRFGNDKLAPIRRRQSGAEDEKRRAQ
ncbi:TonB-dependent receptor [Hymenobacter qilianensis]|uniref:TonB-dependent receptor n=2 Tax=Hymenobacter qilianensis TaxID=1385715 RepID=A0ACB5PQX9_9BACT|nr:TonB-dependent receptor [Hymenobacter qilianensis]